MWIEDDFSCLYNTPEWVDEKCEMGFKKKDSDIKKEIKMKRVKSWIRIIFIRPGFQTKIFSVEPTVEHNIHNLCVWNEFWQSDRYQNK